MTLAANDIAALATALVDNGLDELHLTGPGTDVHLTRPGIVRTCDAMPGRRAEPIVAPGVGVFLARHPLRVEPLAPPGHRVRAGQVVALLRIGPLLRQVMAPADGVIEAALVEEGAMVGYGTTLFQFHTQPPEVQR